MTLDHLLAAEAHLNRVIGALDTLGIKATPRHALLRIAGLVAEARLFASLMADPELSPEQRAAAGDRLLSHITNPML